MHLSRDSSGRNWNPHLIVGSVPSGAVEGVSYDISVGTLSDVIPFPPGQVLMISTSSGVDVYTAATLKYVRNEHALA